MILCSGGFGDLFDSFWQGPKAGAVVICTVGLVIAFVVRHFVRSAAKRRFREECGKSAAGAQGVRIKLSKSGSDDSKSVHVDANTMPLGLNKLVKTGPSCDVR